MCNDTVHNVQFVHLEKFQLENGKFYKILLNSLKQHFILF